MIFVTADPSQQVTYGQLIGGERFNLMVNADAVPKDPSQYTVLGTSVPRYEIPAKMTGEFQYVQHVRLPNMLHGKVVRPPVVGATVIDVDEHSVEHLPGNVRVVRVNDFVGVVADKEWQALQAAMALQVTWSEGVALPPRADFYNYLRQQPSRDSYTVLNDDVGEHRRRYLSEPVSNAWVDRQLGCRRRCSRQRSEWNGYHLVRDPRRLSAARQRGAAARNT